MNLVYYVSYLSVLAIVAAFLGPRTRAALLLLASLGFYGFIDWRFPLLLLAIIAVTYGGGRWIEASGPKNGFAAWVCGLAVFMPLGFYKYILTWLEALQVGLPTSDLYFGGYGAVLIPVGLSFYTFQCLGYLIDVKRGAYGADRNPMRLGLFICFFPQLLAGPIERYSQLAEPLWSTKRPTPSMAMEGLLWIVYGLFLKIVVADRLAVPVDEAFHQAGGAGAQGSLIAFFGFYFQLFGDFGGYSLIALGAGLLFGIRLTDNFKQPFFACSIVEFWQRWHISLTRWVGDYVYRPVGRWMLRHTAWSRNIQESMTAVITWVTIGLWHGATLTFLSFGVVQAGLILLYKSRARTKGRVPLWRLLAGWLMTFVIVAVSFGLVRSPDMTSYWGLLAALLSFADGSVALVQAWLIYLSIAIMVAIEGIRRFFPVRGLPENFAISAALLTFGIMFILLFGFEGGRSFVYFRF